MRLTGRIVMISHNALQAISVSMVTRHWAVIKALTCNTRVPTFYCGYSIMRLAGCVHHGQVIVPPRTSTGTNTRYSQEMLVDRYIDKVCTFLAFLKLAN